MLACRLGNSVWHGRFGHWLECRDVPARPREEALAVAVGARPEQRGRGEYGEAPAPGHPRRGPWPRQNGRPSTDQVWRSPIAGLTVRSKARVPGLSALVEVADSRQHLTNHSIMLSGNGPAIRPMMDASARDIEQVAELFPREAGPAPDLHDGFGCGFRGPEFVLPRRAGGGGLGAPRDRRSHHHGALSVRVGCRHSWENGGDQHGRGSGAQSKTIHGTNCGSVCLRRAA